MWLSICEAKVHHAHIHDFPISTSHTLEFYSFDTQCWQTASKIASEVRDLHEHIHYWPLTTEAPYQELHLPQLSLYCTQILCSSEACIEICIVSRCLISEGNCLSMASVHRLQQCAPERRSKLSAVCCCNWSLEPLYKTPKCYLTYTSCPTHRLKGL